MKKIREFSRSYIFLSFLYMAIGVVLLVWPTISIQMIGKGLGVIMLVVGATYGVIYFTSEKRQEGYLQVELVIGIICMAFGVFVLLTPDFMRMVLPFAMATVLLVGAIVKIQSAVSMKRLFVRKWYLALIGALIIIALGIVLLVYPFAKDSQMLIYIGICLIADGATNLLGLLCIRLRTGKLEKIQRTHPGVDVQALIEDEWAKSDAAKAEKKARKQEKKEQKRQKEQDIVVESEDVRESSEVADSGAAGSSESMDEYDGREPEAEDQTDFDVTGADDLADAKSGNSLFHRARIAIDAKKHDADNCGDEDSNASAGTNSECGDTSMSTGGEEPS
ncbi:MAG: DUF308 domain-containing protein [Lachnospiraceae bacterium]|nr:DUF308 domain-containing protein [Lachnospiraceae bacterium]